MIEDISIVIREEERQVLLLALHKLKLERPGWAYLIGEIETKLGGQLSWPQERQCVDQAGK